MSILSHRDSPRTDCPEVPDKWHYRMVSIQIWCVVAFQISFNSIQALLPATQNIIYYYKKENNFLVLLFTILRYEDGYKREIPSESYRLNKKSN